MESSSKTVAKEMIKISVATGVFLLALTYIGEMIIVASSRGYNRLKKLVAIFLILAIPLFVIYPPKQETIPATLEKSLPWLHVEGNQIVYENGSKVILRGAAVEDPYFLDVVAHHFLEADFAELSSNWHADVVRVPIYPDLWEHDPKYTEKYLDPIVSWGRKYGMYILLGWHAHGNPITDKVELPSWRKDYPWHGNPYNPNLDLAISFWHEVSERYKGDSWVIYSIFDEPSYITWRDWRPVAEQLIDVIRSHNPKALILVSGVNWAYDLRGVAEDPVQRDNIAYEPHVYPGQLIWYGPWEEYFGFLSEDYPLFVGEWGFESGSENRNLNSTNEDFGLPLLKYMEEKGASWTGWCWSPSWAPRMLENWDYETTEFGQLVKDALLGRLTVQVDYTRYILGIVAIAIGVAIIVITLSKRIKEALTRRIITNVWPE